MKKIVPFKKELPFKTNIAEITSISIEHSLHLSDNNLITGSFMLTGDYKISETSSSTEKFSFDLPFDITIDDKYKLDHVTLDIDDFYYEIIDNKMLSVNIEVLIDKLEEKPLIQKEIIEQKEMTLEDTLEELKEEKMKENILDIDSDEDKRCYDDEEVQLQQLNEKTEVPFKQLDDKVEAVSKNSVKSLFDNFDSTAETFSTYKVCIVRENDNVDTIIQKYSITKEELSLYNDLSDLKIGDKLIIPSQNAKV